MTEPQSDNVSAHPSPGDGFLRVSLSPQGPRALDDVSELAGALSDLKARRVLVFVLIIFGLTGALLASLIGVGLVVAAGAIVFGIMIVAGGRLLVATERAIANVTLAITLGAVVEATVSDAVQRPGAQAKTQCMLRWGDQSRPSELVGRWQDDDNVHILVTEDGTVLVPLERGIILSPLSPDSPA